MVGSKREVIPLNSVFRKEFSQLDIKEPTTREVFPVQSCGVSIDDCSPVFLQSFFSVFIKFIQMVWTEHELLHNVWLRMVKERAAGVVIALVSWRDQ